MTTQQMVINLQPVSSLSATPADISVTRLQSSPSFASRKHFNCSLEATEETFIVFKIACKIVSEGRNRKPQHNFLYNKIYNFSGSLIPAEAARNQEEVVR